MRQLLNSLVTHNKLVTTESRAKLLKKEIERLISRSKRLDLTVRRRALALFSKASATKFLEQIVPQFQERVGGYVRVVKLPHRRGDHAPLARVEFVEEIKEQVRPSRPEKAIKATKTVKSVKPAKAAKTVKEIRAVKREKVKNAKNKSHKRN